MKEQPALFVVMGVSGCGKTTIAKRIAETFGFSFLEADDLHSHAAKAKMAEGVPLSDTDRDPWISAICEQVKLNQEKRQSTVLACSALKRKHRERFRETGDATNFLFLDGSETLIRSRMEQRRDHFFSPDLLNSQFQALERPSNEPDIQILPVDGNIDEITAYAARLVQELKG